MPIPWKKGKFSRILTNHLNSAKKSGSLVVETGFPTSLVDLFVKNRERSSKKKRDRNPDVEQSAGESYPVPSSPARTVSSPASFSDISQINSFSSSPPIWRTPIRPIESSSATGAADLKGVLFAIMKVFFVVAFALGTNQFVVGLIISTFSLISMEFIGKHLCRLLKPCQHARITLRNFVERVRYITRIKNNQTPGFSIDGQSKENQIEEEKPSSKPPRTVSGSRSFHLLPESEEFPIGGSLSHCKSLNCLSEEMGKNHYRSDNSKLKSKIMKMLTTSKKKDEIEYPISDSDQKSSKSRGSRLKSKIKKIVLIKNSKKKHEQNNCICLPDFLRIEEPIVCYRQEQSCTSTTDNEENREAAVSVLKETAEERRDDFGCCVVLLPIILMGLVGGRFWAIVLTLAWCSIWKLTAWMLWKSSFSS